MVINVVITKTATKLLNDKKLIIIAGAVEKLGTENSAYISNVARKSIGLLARTPLPLIFS